MFAEQYDVIHRLETNKLRNVAKFFAHLLYTDAISWEVGLALYSQFITQLFNFMAEFCLGLLCGLMEWWQLKYCLVFTVYKQCWSTFNNHLICLYTKNLFLSTVKTLTHQIGCVGDFVGASWELVADLDRIMDAPLKLRWLMLPVPGRDLPLLPISSDLMPSSAEVIVVNVVVLCQLTSLHLQTCTRMPMRNCSMPSPATIIMFYTTSFCLSLNGLNTTKLLPSLLNWSSHGQELLTMHCMLYLNHISP